MWREHDAELRRQLAKLERFADRAGLLARRVDLARREPRQHEVIGLGRGRRREGRDERYRNGPALAGGMGLVVACDVVVAADTAQFGTTEIAVGLWPMMITAEIVRNIGRKKTLELMLTGKKISAADALACGLVTRVVPAAEL